LNQNQHIEGKTSYDSLFRELFDNYFTGLCLFSIKFVSNEDIAKDIVHDVFIELWKKKSEIDFSSSLKSYLFTSVRNRSLNYIRDHKKIYPEGVDQLHNEPDQESTPEEEMQRMETEGRINDAIQSIPEKSREVFELSRFENLKYWEIAKQLNISVKTVEAHMSKALQLLREKLKDLLLVFLWLLINIFN
jgi:RNA polymerase sigma-70 factor (ECF subfamily)